MEQIFDREIFYTTDFRCLKRYAGGVRGAKDRMGGYIKNEFDINQKKININQKLEFIDQNDLNKNHNSLVLNPLHLIVSGLH